jgi:hypothetical protein
LLRIDFVEWSRMTMRGRRNDGDEKMDSRLEMAGMVEGKKMDSR